MAKKKKHKSTSDRPGAAPPADGGGGERAAAEKSAEKSAGTSAAPSPLERAFQAGNFAAVRQLAVAHPGPEADRLLALAKIDGRLLLIGAGALAFMVLVALLVLRAG